MVTIKANNKGTNRVFHEALHVVAYAWNSAPFDGTDIVQSYPAFGHVFRFPMDVALGGAKEDRACKFATTGRYVVDFFAKYSQDKDRSDPNGRWWPKWREFCNLADGTMELSTQVEFAPNRKPDLRKYTTYSDVINLCDGDIVLLGPFDFKDAAGQRPRNCMPVAVWFQLCNAVQSCGVAAPMLHEPSRQKHLR